MTKEIAWIQRRQREFESLFGKQLLIDFDRMIGVDSTTPIRKSAASGVNNKELYRTSLSPIKFLKKLEDEMGADMEIVRSSRVRKGKYSPERMLLITFSKAVMANDWNPNYCASLIGKSRETIYYYASQLENSPGIA